MTENLSWNSFDGSITENLMVRTFMKTRLLKDK